MKQNSYDVPAYKFGIFKFKNTYGGNGKRPTSKQLQDALGSQSDNLDFIPFDNVDGLMINEVEECLNTKDILFVMYTQSSVNTPYGREDNLRTYFQIYMNLDEEEGTIEEALGATLAGGYCNELDKPTSQRAVKCFFERYLDYSPRKTKKRIKYLDKIKKSIKVNTESSDNNG